MTLSELLKLKTLREVCEWSGIPLDSYGDYCETLHGRRVRVYTKGCSSVEIGQAGYGPSSITEYSIDANRPAELRAFTRWLVTGDFTVIRKYHT